MEPRKNMNLISKPARIIKSKKDNRVIYNVAFFSAFIKYQRRNRRKIKLTRSSET